MSKRPTLIFKSLGGLDFDSADSQIAPEDYRFAENMRNSVSYSGQQFIPCNMNGNVLVAYNLTSANCKCLGGVEDKQDGTILYFVWSDDSKHKILRYYPSDNGNGEIQLVTEFNFNWKKRERITGIDFISGNLLYWTDSVKPRQINTDKANNTNKFKTWKVHLPISTNSADGFQIAVKDITTNVTILSQQINVPAGTREEKLKALADAINDIGQSLHLYLKAEACDCSIIITETKANSYNVLFTNPDYKVVPENWYGKNLVDRFFDACKYPSLYNPIPNFKKDESVEFNYVKNKVLFFRLGYEYADFEESALSPISNVITNNLNCQGGSSKEYNYIDVDFNDPNLIDPNIWVILKKVTLYVKEHNVGVWRKVISLTPCDFFDLIDGQEVAHYKFYNNSNTIGVAQTFSDKQYDNLPRKANAQKFAKNRITYGGVLEGYDEPECVSGSYTIDFVDQPNPKLYKVTFRVRVLTYGLGDSEQAGVGFNFYNMFPTINKYPFWYPNYNIVRGGIFHDTTRTENNFAFFGGGGFGAGPGGDFGIRAGMEDIYDQRCPEGGFPLYLAGTQYLGVTKQINVNLAVDGNNALDTASDAQKSAIGEYLYSGNDLYSEVTLLVPAGEYVARLGSHWCSFGDKIGKGFMYDLSLGTQYQKTSTNVWGIVPAGQDPLTSFLPEKEIRITVTNSDIAHAGTFIVADLAPPHDITIGGETTDRWQPINAYLYDSLGNTEANSESFLGQSVEKALVSWLQSENPPTTPSGKRVFWSESAFTDHNGYFFGISSFFFAYFPIKAYSVGGLISDTTIIYTGSLSDLFKKTLSPYSFDQSSNNGVPDPFITGLVFGIVTTTNQSARELSSSFVKGKVVGGNGMPVESVTTVYESGRVDLTNSAGEYNFLVWGDMVTVNIGNASGVDAIVSNNKDRIVDELIFSLPVSCAPNYPNGQVYSPIVISVFGNNTGEYNPNFPYVLANFIVNENNNPSLKAHKRGGKYTYVGRLYDDSGRSCSCFRIFDIYVPFITEDLHNSLPSQYPAGTFRYGKPSIKWEIDPTTVFPSWAKTFQWMRTKNTIYGRYLQWAANQVIYLSAVKTTETPDIETSASNQDAVAIKISLKNIITYLSVNNDSLVTYEYKPGDRLRLISDRNLVPINGINDFEITGYDLDSQSIIIKPDSFPTEIKSGTLLEIFNPNSVATLEQEIFYEVGEVIPINNGILQSYSGTFLNGDTYWRGRSILVNDDTNNFSSIYQVTVEDGNISDFFLSPDSDIGRIGIIDVKFRELFRGNSFRVSEQYIPDTGINGLSSFNNIDDVELGKEFGSIMKLETSGFVLLAICENKNVSNYLGAIQGATPDGNMVISSQQGYIGDSRPLIGDYGTQHPATVVEKDGWVWGADFQRGIIWKYDNNGLDEISEQKAKTYFKQLAKKGIWDAVASYDSFYGEYILTAWENRFDERVSTSFFNGVLEIKTNNPNWYNDGDTIELTVVDKNTNEISSVYGYVTGVNGNVVSAVMENWTYEPKSVTVRMKGTGRTIAYQKDKQRWTTFYSYLPDAMCAVGMKLVTWNNGQLYLQDVGPIGTFYGLFYKWKLTLLCKAEGFPVLLWSALQLEQTQNNEDKVNSWSVPVITNNLNQLSRITKGAFVKLEEYWNASFRKDLNTLSTPNPIVDGKDLRSSVLKLEMENDADVIAELRATNVLVIDSSGNR